MKRAEASVEVDTDEEVLISRNGPCGLYEVFTKHFVLRLRSIANRCVAASHMYNRSSNRQLREEQSWMRILHLENAGRRGVDAVVCAEVYRFLCVEACLLDRQYVELEVDHRGGEVLDLAEGCKASVIIQ
eukprot:4628705-Amphidinium_carterae.1